MKIRGLLVKLLNDGKITKDDINSTLALADRNFRWTKLYKIKDKQKNTVPFKLNRIQLEIEAKIKEIEKAGKPLRLIILKPRQIGCTTYFCIRNLDQCYTKRNQFCAVIAHLVPKAQEIFNEIIKFSYDSLPESIRFKAHNDSTHQLSWRAIQSQIKVTSEGHGITPNLLHLTEVAHMRNPKDMISEALQGVPLHSGLVVMESTANGRGGYFYDTWEEAINDPESVWQPLFLKWWHLEDYCLAVPDDFKSTDEEKEILEKFKDDGFNEGHLVFRRLKIKELGGERIDIISGLSGLMSFKQNYPMTANEAFRVPAGSLFNIASLDYMDLNKVEPIKISQVGRGFLKVFYELDKDQEYIISADTSFGASNDYSVAIVFERWTKRMMATLRGKYTSNEFAKYLLKLGKFYHEALIAVERNMGAAVLNELINHSDYRNIYYHEEYDQYRNRSWKPGFYTSGQSRNLILGNLEEDILSRNMKIEDPVVIGECLAFGLRGTKYQALIGNDDCVLALAIGNYLCNLPQINIPERIMKPAGI